VSRGSWIVPGLFNRDSERNGISAGGGSSRGEERGRHVQHDLQPKHPTASLRPVAVNWNGRYQIHMGPAKASPTNNQREELSCINDSRSTIHDPPFTIHDPRSTIHDPRSTIHDPRSTIHDPRSTIHDPRFTFSHPPRVSIRARPASNIRRSRLRIRRSCSNYCNCLPNTWGPGNSRGLSSCGTSSCSAKTVRAWVARSSSCRSRCSSVNRL
jgi:hypothetical protein